MSTLNTFICDTCGYSVCGSTKMKPLSKRSFIDILRKKKRKIEYEYNEDYHDTPCPKCSGVLHIDPKATLFFHDREPDYTPKKRKLHLLETTRVDYKCTDCSYKIYGRQSLYKNIKRSLLSPFYRGFLTDYIPSLDIINENYLGELCPVCKKGTFIEYNKWGKSEQKIVLPNDNDTAKKSFARNLVHHLEEAGQMPKADPEELETYLANSFPLAENNTKCSCDEPNCAKCLAVNCKDDNCLVHTKEAKEKWKKRRGL